MSVEAGENEQRVAMGWYAGIIARRSVMAERECDGSVAECLFAHASKDPAQAIRFRSPGRHGLFVRCVAVRNRRGRSFHRYSHEPLRHESTLPGDQPIQSFLYDTSPVAVA